MRAALQRSESGPKCTGIELRGLGIAVMVLAGCSPLWSQQPPAAEAQDGPDPSSSSRVRAAGPLSSSEPALSDAPSSVSAAAASEGGASASSSVPAPPAAAPPGYDADAPAVVRPAEKPPSSQKFHWVPALRQSLLFLLIEHGFRLGTQRFTRKNTVEGPFFLDWFDSVRGQLPSKGCNHSACKCWFPKSNQPCSATCPYRIPEHSPAFSCQRSGRRDFPSN
jgi:hypothetical protein